MSNTSNDDSSTKATVDNQDENQSNNDKDTISDEINKANSIHISNENNDTAAINKEMSKVDDIHISDENNDDNIDNNAQNTNIDVSNRQTTLPSNEDITQSLRQAEPVVYTKSKETRQEKNIISSYWRWGVEAKDETMQLHYKQDGHLPNAFLL